VSCSVTCIKHVFEAHVVFQFNCTNTISEQVLENVSVTMDLADAEEFAEEAVVPLSVMPYNGTGETYVVLSRPGGSMASGSFVNILRFTVKEVDPTTGEAEEDGCVPHSSELLCMTPSHTCTYKWSCTYG
jgi:coatomer protein complex subunit gamma